MNEFKCGNCGAIRYEVDNVIAVKCMECDSLECYGPLTSQKDAVADVPLQCGAIKRCPCGATPKHLCIAEGNTCKWAFVSGECCGEWQVEFRTEYRDLASDEVTALALKAWNETPRAL